MKRIRWCILVLACFLSGAANALAQEVPSPQDLMRDLNESAKVYNSQPYRLTATFLLTPEKNAEMNGEIHYTRDKDHARIEITAGTYHETRVIAGDRLYVAGTSELVLPRKHMLETLEESWTTVPPGKSCCKEFGQVERKKILGTGAYCFVVNSGKARPKRVCMDAQNKTLLETSDGFETVRFLDYHTLDGFHYPARIQVVDGGKTFLEIQNIELRKEPAPAESFAAPAGGQVFENCADMEAAHAVRMNMPNVPSTSYSSYASVYGLVQPDGSFTNVQVHVSRASQEFAQALKEAAAQWKFSPAKCGGKAVISEEQMEIHN